METLEKVILSTKHLQKTNDQIEVLVIDCHLTISDKCYLFSVIFYQLFLVILIYD